MRARISTARALTLFTGLEKRVKAHAASAEALTLADAKVEAVEASSGTLSTAELRRRDHPYARRHGEATEDPEVINSQSGRLRRSWTARKTRTTKRLEGRLRNTDPKAAYMHGTEHMLPRPITRRIARKVSKIRRYRLRRSLWSAVLSTSGGS